MIKKIFLDIISISERGSEARGDGVGGSVTLEIQRIYSREEITVPLDFAMSGGASLPSLVSLPLMK
jgi:hypothetical protein